MRQEGALAVRWRHDMMRLPGNTCTCVRCALFCFHFCAVFATVAHYFVLPGEHAAGI